MHEGIGLRGWLAVAATLAFVAVLVVITGDLELYWPLFGIPIVISAITHRGAGALVTSALAVAAASVLSIELQGSAPSGPVLLGLSVFVVVGLAVGAYAAKRDARMRELRACAVRDPVTGVYTEDCLFDRLTEETHRADRYETSLSVMILRADGMSAYHERFGHQRAGMLAARLADVIRISVRDTDVLARHGDGFALILPFTDMEGAATAAERVVGVVRDAEFEGDELEPVVRLTTSVGVASYPEEGEDEQQLVLAALEAARGAARDGGDRVRRGSIAATRADARPAADTRHVPRGAPQKGDA